MLSNNGNVCSMVPSTHTASLLVKPAPSGMPAVLLDVANVSSNSPGARQESKVDLSAGNQNIEDLLFPFAVDSLVSRNKDRSKNLRFLDSEILAEVPAEFRLKFLYAALDEYCAKPRSAIFNLEILPSTRYLSADNHKTLYLEIKRCLSDISLMPIDKASAFAVVMCGTLRSFIASNQGLECIDSQDDSNGKPLICELWQDTALIWRALAENSPDYRFAVAAYDPAMLGLVQCVVDKVAPKYEIIAMLTELQKLNIPLSQALMGETFKAALQYVENLKTITFAMVNASSDPQSPMKKACSAFAELSSIGEKFASNYAKLKDSSSLSTQADSGLLKIIDKYPFVFLGLI
jgi:hypothetical protein